MKKVYKIVHMDDDLQSLQAFRSLAESRGYLDYKGGFNNAIDAADFIKSNDVDIAVLDVEMDGEDGFWLASQIQHMPVDIIFLSAHSEYAVKGFEACALDFLVKPLFAEKLDECIARYRHRQSKMRATQLLQVEELFKNYLPMQEVPKRLFVSSVGSIEVLLLQDILYFSAQESYTVIYRKDGTQITASKTMKIYEEALVNNLEFIRIHRRFVINKEYIKTILRDGRKQKYAVVMSNGDELEISYLKKDDILARLSS